MLTLRTGDESPAPPEPARPAETARPQPQQARSDLDRRLDDLQAEIARLRERVLAERRRRATGEHRDEAAHARPRSLGEWIRQEEVALREAEGRHDEERIAWHRARLGILREMREAGLRLPVERLERVERRLDEILELLQRRK